MSQEEKKDFWFDVYNHEVGESFQIYSLQMFIQWLNDNDDVFTFKVREEKQNESRDTSNTNI
jgi:hypothetical protein